MVRRSWQRLELILALNLYCRLPFGQYHSRNPEIIELAGLIGRTPDALAMKLSNFASMDPYHQGRGIKGLPNRSRGDQEIWEEFNSDWERLAVESEIAFSELVADRSLVSTPESRLTQIEQKVRVFERTQADRLVKTRIGQTFFRRVILVSYRHRCCICEMPLPELLVASHIIAWSDNESLRVNPQNGLCLCVIHDKGFDRGLFTLGKSYEVVIGSRLRQHQPNSAIASDFLAHEGRRIELPDKFIPDHNYLEYHREHYFDRGN